MNSAPERARWLLISWIVLALITVGAAALRLYRLDQPLWTDELHTAWIASGPLSEVAWRAEMGNQGPLFYYVEWLFGRVFGVSEITMRLMSVLAGVALVPMAYGLVLRWTGRPWAGLLAAALAAVDVDFLFYAQEARPYACVQLLAALHVIVFWRLLNRPTTALRATWVVGAALLFYLHYTAILIVVAELIAYGVLRCVPRLRPVYRPTHAAIDGAIAVLLMLPATGHLAAIFARRGNWEALVGTDWPVSLKRMAGVYVLVPAALVFASAIGKRLISQPAERASEQHHTADTIAPDKQAHFRGWVLVACWAILPVGFAWMATYVNFARLFMLRYVIGSALGAIVAAGISCALYRSSAARAAAMLVVLAMALYTSPIARDLINERKLRGERTDDWRSAVEHLNKSGGELPVLVAAGLIDSDDLRQPHDERRRQYCLFPVLSIYRLDRDGREMAPLPWTSPGLLSPESMALIVEHGGAWVMIRGTPQYVREAEADLLDLLNADGMSARITETLWFGTVAVLRVEVSVELLAAGGVLQ